MLHKAVCGLLLVLLVMFAACQEDRVSQGDVMVTLDSLEQKIDWMHFRIAAETWDIFTSGQADSLEFYHKLYDQVVSDDVARQALERGRNMVRDDDDRRRLDIISAELLAGAVESDHSVSMLRDSLQLANTLFRPTLGGEPSTGEAIAAVQQSSADRTRRELAYKARYAVGSDLSDGVGRLFRMRSQACRKTGYNSYIAMSFGRLALDQDDYLHLLAQVDSLTAGPYQAVLERIRNRLSVRELEIWDLAYAFSDIQRQIDSYYPADSQMRFVVTGLREMGFNLVDLPVYTDIEVAGDGRSHAVSLVVQSPFDQRVVARLGAGIDDSRMIMRELGRVLFSAHITDARPLFSTVQSAAWEEGMGRVFSALCSDSAWLTGYAHVPPALSRQFAAAEQERRLIRLRTWLVDLMFEYEAYLNPGRDLNELYWDLFEQYLFLPRHDDIQPWAAKVEYVTRPMYSQNYLFADIIAQQTLAYIKRTNGTAVANPETRSFLVQNYFRFGSRYDWRELLQRGTGEDLNPAYAARIEEP